ncbi:MAG: protein phosphatase CheZ [Pseudomonadales bacterium]|nr:protein phosphatase CheZ [Pseudomonadales bacterium]
MAVDKTTAGSNEEASSEEFTRKLKQHTLQLLEKLEADDIGAANELIREINGFKDQTLYHEIGRLTRALHNALKDFHLDIGLHGYVEVESELSEIADARSRLHYVIKLTEDAANRTMDMVEASEPVLSNLVEEAKSLQAQWQQAKGGDDQVKLYAQVDSLLSRMTQDGAQLHGRLNDILMAQGFQDLSGQVIKRVIDLVSDVERSLVRLVKLASDVEVVAGVSNPVLSKPASKANKEDQLRAEGPLLQNTKSVVVSGQDDVDELLSSLGF